MTSMEAKEKFGIPQHFVEVDSMQGYRLTYSELCISVGAAGKFIRRLWVHEDTRYGFAEMVSGGVVHGKYNIDAVNFTLSIS